jgi:cytosine/adenosine deaminase-related metal-dependent hydrolase
MILNNLVTAGTDDPVSIRIDDGKITSVCPTAIADANDTLTLHFETAMVFPGLVNSHDHLDFNLYPNLGHRTYNNYTEWGRHIHKTYKTEIAAVLKVPSVLRYEWGVFKNLLCGVTTVVNHGEPSGLKDDLITIFEGVQALHSVGLESAWRLKLNNPFNTKLPVCIHVGEGDDWLSFSEINQLTGWNFFRRSLVGVHAVAMSENQAKKFKALVWCPQSNYFLLNKTAPVNLLKKHAEILFGTDSTLTGSWDIWEHLRLARQTRLLDDEALYQTLNQNATKAWELNSGLIEQGKDADVVVAQTKKGMRDYHAFFALRPEDLLLVIHKGNIRLFDEKLAAQLKAVDLDNFSRIYVNGACKYVQGNLPGLMAQISEYYPEANFPVSSLVEHQKTGHI